MYLYRCRHLPRIIGGRMNIVSLTDYKSSCCCGKAAKVHPVVFLPVAPQVVARTRFSPPTPVRSLCLLVPEAMELLHQKMGEKGESITTVAITGPGDPLATPDITLEIVQRIRQTYPEMKIVLKTLGMGSEKLAGELARAGITAIEMMVDGIKAEILEKIYAWIRPGLKTLKIHESAELLVREQRNGVPALKFHDIKVTILTTLYPGLNIDHIPKISASMLVLGADGIVLNPYSPEPGAEVHLDCPSPEVIQAIREKARISLPIVETLLIEPTGEPLDKASPQTRPLPRPNKKRPNVAVVSSNGIDIDLHLGQAVKILIYGPIEDGPACLLEARDAPEPGTTDRWTALATLLHDCIAVMAASAGDTPRRVLTEAGIRVLITEDNIEGSVDVLYGGGKKGKTKKK